MPNAQISTLDTSLLVGYFVIVLVIGFIFVRRTNTGRDFFLAGNRLGWTAIGFSLFASNISGSSIIGLTGQAYATGISIANYEWMATLVLIFMALFVIPIYLKNKLSTIPEFLEKRYNPFTRKYYSLVTIILTIIIDIASCLFAGALLIHVFLPDISVATACYTMALVSGIYTAAGGLAAVVYTDMLQVIILLIGGAIMLFAVLGQYDFDWNEAVSHIDSNRMKLIQPIDDPTLPWLGTLIGVPILGFYYWATNQYVVQRVLAARSIPHAQWGALFGGLLKLLVLFVIVFPGIMALHLFPDLPNYDMVYPTMLLNLIPAGVKGIVLAALIAAIMSTVDSALNGSSALIVLDFIKPSRKDLDEKDLIRLGRITTMLVMLVAGLWAPVIGNFEGLFNYLQQVLAYSVPPVVAIFLHGFFWKKGSGIAAKYTLIFGHLLCFVAMGMSIGGLFNIHFTIMAGILFFVCNIIFIMISILLPGEDREIGHLIWSRAILANKPDVPIYLQAKNIALLLTLLTIIMVFFYW